MLAELLHWLAVHTGTVDEAGPYYGFFSGFGSDLGEFTIAGGITGALTALLRHRNCEVSGCWRLSRHTTAAAHRVCRRHNPDGAPSHQDVIDAHNAARRAAR